MDSVVMTGYQLAFGGLVLWAMGWIATSLHFTVADSRYVQITFL